MTVRRDRRRILGVIAATGGVALISSLSSVPRRRLPLGTALLRVLSQPEGAVGIGRAYLDQFPSEANSRQLVSLIAERLPGAGVGFGLDSSSQVDVEDLRERLNTAVRHDFTESRTVELNGWVISRTEARLCALTCVG